MFIDADEARGRQRERDTKEKEVNRIKIEGNAVCLPAHAPFPAPFSTSLSFSFFCCLPFAFSAFVCKFADNDFQYVATLGRNLCYLPTRVISLSLGYHVPLPLSAQSYLSLSQWLCSWNECRVNALADVASDNGCRMDMTSIALATHSHTHTVACKPIPIRQGCNMYLC